MVKFRLQNIDLPQTTMERIEALIYLVAKVFLNCKEGMRFWPDLYLSINE